MPIFAELEIAIGPLVDKQAGYPTVLRLFAIKSDEDRRFPATGPAHVKLDLEELHNLRTDYPKYDALLSERFFADPDIRGGFEAALAITASAGSDAMLRVRLFLDSAADELHRIRWESLRMEGRPLFGGNTVLFSRYLSSKEMRPLEGKGQTKVLIAIAGPDMNGVIDPEDDSKDLTAVDVAGEKARVDKSLRNLRAQVTCLAAAPHGTAPATLDNILQEAGKGCDILYLVSHGGLIPEPDAPGGMRAKLWLDDEETPVNAIRLANGIRALQRRPRLVVLASCQSAGSGTVASGSLAALGPMLADAGVPAVVAMQGSVKMTTLSKFMPKFFEELAKDGQIDRAMGIARARVVGDPNEPDCDDFWMPTLFMRLRSGRIWYTPRIGSIESGAPGEDDKWKLISNAVYEKGADGSAGCRCTPIIGPGALEMLSGSLQELAETLAEKYGYPMASYSREEIPTVTQYISVNQDQPIYAKKEFVKFLVGDLARRYPSDAMSKLDPTQLSNAAKILREAGRQFRRQNPQDPHRLLATRPFPIYVTVMPDDSMEEALKEAGRDPRSDFSRWNTDPIFDLLNYKKYPTIFDREPNYTPSIEQPLVYHLFGLLDPPGPMDGFAPDPASIGKEPRETAGCASIVVTEDDFFQYMLSILSKTGTKEETPLVVRAALAANSLLFFGFRLEDWSFRVLLRSIFTPAGAAARQVGANSYPSIGAQVQPDESRNALPTRAASYYRDYFQRCKISTFWGSVGEFADAFDRNVPADPKYLAAVNQALKV
ncbi:MAG: CHAT domain-containing protein [Acidobacteria bacterium]|nr:CHAT domain-containing protein [Acidobacteriota bacterium]